MATSTNTLLAQVTGAVTGQDVFDYGAGGEGDEVVRGEGQRHNKREETGMPDVTVRASRQLRTLGRRKTTLPFVGRVV